MGVGNRGLFWFLVKDSDFRTAFLILDVGGGADRSFLLVLLVALLLGRSNTSRTGLVVMAWMGGGDVATLLEAKLALELIISSTSIGPLLRRFSLAGANRPPVFMADFKGLVALVVVVAALGGVTVRRGEESVGGAFNLGGVGELKEVLVPVVTLL